MSATEKLAKFAVETTYYDLPQKTIKYAKDLALSNVGVMVWGSTLPAGRIVSKFVKDMGAVPEAGVFGSGFKTTVAEATLCGGTFAHAAEWEGDSRPEMVGVMPIFPAVFTLGEKLGSSGKDILTAAIIGHEVSARIGLACVTATSRGFFAVPVMGNFGSAIAAAKLLKLNVEQTMVAMSLAASQAAGTLRQHDTMAHFVETGFAARNGVMAALMAKAGINADKNILEDTDSGVGFCSAVAGKENFQIEKLTENLGKDLRFDHLDTKHFPCHSYIQRSIEAALQLVHENNINYKDVASVEVEMKPSFARDLDHPSPPDGEHARVSVQHAIAAVLLEKRVDINSFTDEKTASAAFIEARQKVKVVPRPQWEKEKDFEIVTIILKNGKKFSSKWDTWRGHHTSPFNETELTAKFKDATAETLSPKQIDRAIELLMSLDSLKDVSELMKLVCFPSKK